MPTRDPRIDAYIREAPPFAKPVLTHVRKLIHQACPKVEETLKWGVPHFLYNDKILCGVAAFKAHCAFGFWKGSMIVDDKGRKANAGMGSFGRLTAVGDLPSKKVLSSYVKQAMKLNEDGARPTKRPIKHKKPPLRPPADFMRALKANPKALKTYQAFSPSQQREYVEWITDAKTEETRERRLETSIDWISVGKTRMWKYR